jgi:three-Cys-motif partner protein
MTDRRTANRFGGPWTAQKLAVLEEYLHFYAQALKSQPFKLVYIDAFAGTGRCHVKDETVGGQVIDGSACIALNCDPPFACYHFIEKRRRHVKELQELIDGHPNGSRAHLAPRNASDMLPPILACYDWRKTRGVLFLDPFGLQCSWSLLKRIAATQALDVFFLLSLSGLYRQAALDARNIDEGKAAILTDVLGTNEWRTHIYRREQGDLFDGPQVTRDPGYTDILDFTTQRLRALFPYVGDPYLLGTANGAPLFALYFMAANPGKKALALAARVSKEILSKLR